MVPAFVSAPSERPPVAPCRIVVGIDLALTIVAMMTAWAQNPYPMRCITCFSATLLVAHVAFAIWVATDVAIGPTTYALASNTTTPRDETVKAVVETLIPYVAVLFWRLYGFFNLTRLQWDMLEQIGETTTLLAAPVP